MTGSAAWLPGLMAGYLAKTTIVLALALLAAAVARKRPAALRHFILSSALIGLLLLPLLTLARVGWRSPLLPAWMADTLPRTLPATAEADQGRADAGASQGARPPAAMIVTAAAPEDAALPGPVSPAAGAFAPAGLGSDPPPPRSIRGAGPVGLAAAFVWTAGLAILLLRLAVGLAGAARLTAKSAPLRGAPWRVLLERFLALVYVRRNVRLKTHPEVLVPLTWGWRRPIVLLPEGADGWTDDERSSALFHELSHIKRADFPVMLLVRASLAVFWWNPLCWIVYRELLEEQELACDEMVLRAGIKPSTYAASLLTFRRSAGFRWNPSAALLGLSGRSSLRGRLAAILGQKITFMEVKMRTKITLALTLALAVAFIGTARPAGNDALPAADAAWAPEPPANDIVGPAAAVDPNETPRTTTQEKAKTIVIVPKGSEGRSLEVVITEGDEVKTLVLEKPLTITKSEDGKSLTLTVDGKDVEVLTGEPLRLEIKGGGLRIVREGKAVEIGEGGAFSIVKKDDEEGHGYVFIGKAGPEIAKGKTVKIIKEGETGLTWTVKEGEEGAVWVAKRSEAGSGKDVKIVKVVKEGEKGEPKVAVKIAEPARAYALATRVGTEGMLAKIRGLQEQIQAVKAKKLDLAALEESLKKLEAELAAREEKLERLRIKLEEAPGEIKVIKRIGEDATESRSFAWVVNEDEGIAKATGKVFIGTGDKDAGEISLVFTGEKGEAGKASFGRAVTALKKNLPEGYNIVEQKYDDAKGTMTFKVAVPEGQKTDEKLIRLLVDSVKSTLKPQK